MSIPGPRNERWYEKKALVELAAVFPAILVACVNAYSNWADPHKRLAGEFLIGAAFWLLLASTIRVLHARSEDRNRKRVEEYEGFRAGLQCLYSVVRGAAGLDPGAEDDKLRATIHRVVNPKKEEEVEQLIPYVGDPGGRAGRRFSVRSGIVGRAVRERAVLAAQRTNPDYGEFIRELVKEWAYTESDAHALRQDRQSWMAVPIFGTQRLVIAVVYFDSSLPTLFTREVQQIITHGSSGLTNFATEAYK